MFSPRKLIKLSIGARCSASNVAIDERFGELPVTEYVGKIGGQTDRGTQCASRLAVDHVQELLERPCALYPGNRPPDRLW